MATRRSLIGVGMPTQQAFLLGTDQARDVVLGPNTQAGATLLPGNAVRVVAGGAGPGGAVRMPPAEGQPVHLLWFFGINGNIFPAPGQAMNENPINQSIPGATGQRFIMVPLGRVWFTLP